MNVKVISENTKRKTAMIVIHYDLDGCKRSETRHCKRTSAGLVGRLPDADCNVLNNRAEISQVYAQQVNALNAELNNQAKKARPYSPALFVEWQEGDTSETYKVHIKAEHDRSVRIVDKLKAEINYLEPLAEIRRAEQAAKKKAA